MEIWQKVVSTLKISKGKNKQRELFESFVTKDGLKSFYKDNNFKNLIILKGNFIENEQFLTKLLKVLNQKQADFISFNSIFLPNFPKIFLSK